jgi:hypothetical protein
MVESGLLEFPLFLNAEETDGVLAESTPPLLGLGIAEEFPGLWA